MTEQGQLVPAAEILGNEVAKTLRQLHKELEAARLLTQVLLRHVGQPAVCKGLHCGRPILMVRHIDSGRITPYDPDGVNHFITCPDAPQFKRSKEKTQNVR